VDGKEGEKEKKKREKSIHRRASSDLSEGKKKAGEETG